MAFRISIIKSSGERQESVLIETKQALIANSDDAQLKVNFPPGTSIEITEKSSTCTLTSTQIPVLIKGETFENTSTSIGSGSDFSAHDINFYVTIVRANQLTEFKKGHLATIALLLTWSLLAIQIIVPIWLPYKIISHTVEGRNSLLEKCSTELDRLRRSIKSNSSAMTKISTIHNEVMANLKKEVEQISSIFRQGSEFMSAEQLKQLLDDIALYNAMIQKLLKSSVIEVNPVNPDMVIKGLAL
jgi:hypothetical protein